MPAQDENVNPNLPPPLIQDLQSANFLTDVDNARLAKALKPFLPTKSAPSTGAPKIYTGIVQGVDDKGHSITYCSSHGLTCNIDHNSNNYICKREGHNNEATLNNKMGGVEGHVKMCRTLTSKHRQKLKLHKLLSKINLVSAHPKRFITH